MFKKRSYFQHKLQTYAATDWKTILSSAIPGLPLAFNFKTTKPSIFQTLTGFGIFLLLLISPPLQAQEVPCGTEVTNRDVKYLDGQNSRFKRALKIFDLKTYMRSNDDQHEIPIQAHVIRRADGSGGLTEANIKGSIARAGLHFTPMNMRFFLCDINFIDNDQLYNTDLNGWGTATEINVANANNVPNMVNVYFYEEASTSWAYLPSSSKDWIVMKNSHVGNASTFAHELGHYFGLYHTHETRRTGEELVNGSNCDTAGDLICDTPADPDLFGQVDDNCNYTGRDRDANGQLYNPDPKNIMSYSHKHCRIQFSPEQQARILLAYLTERNLMDGCPKYNARFISQSVPTKMEPYKPTSVSLTFQNSGDLPWNQGFKLMAVFPGWTTQQVPINQVVYPGREVTLTFNVTALSPGDFGFQWKMAPNFGDTFGAPSQKLTVKVSKSNSPGGCGKLNQQLKAANAKLRQWQAMLRTTSPSQKPGIIQQIRRVNDEIASIGRQKRRLGCR